MEPEMCGLSCVSGCTCPETLPYQTETGLCVRKEDCDGKHHDSLLVKKICTQ